MTKSVDELMWLSAACTANFGNEEDYVKARAALRSALEEVVADADRWRYAMNWGTKDFAVCIRVDAPDCWDPINNDGPIDAAMQQAPEQEG